MITTLRLLLLFLSLSSSAFATTPKLHHFDTGNFSIAAPDGWREVRDLFGVPLAFVAPENKEWPRSNILITPTGIVDEVQMMKKGNKDLAPYKKGREAWLEKLGGKSSSYDAYESKKWGNIDEAYFLGYHYTLSTGSFYERSVYITCPNHLIYNIKTLVSGHFEKEHNSVVDEVIKSFKCEKTEFKTAGR